MACDGVPKGTHNGHAPTNQIFHLFKVFIARACIRDYQLHHDDIKFSLIVVLICMVCHDASRSIQNKDPSLFQTIRGGLLTPIGWTPVGSLYQLPGQGDLLWNSGLTIDDEIWLVLVVEAWSRFRSIRGHNKIAPAEDSRENEYCIHSHGCHPAITFSRQSLRHIVTGRFKATIL